MLRLWVLALLLANLVYWSWTQGYGVHLGLDPAGLSRREPERLERQVAPERIRLLETAASGAPAAPAAPEPAAEPPVCLQAGVFSDPQADVLRPALAAILPEGSWKLEPNVQPARWIVYSGRLPNAEALAARKAELRQMKVEFRDVTLPTLQPGLALGTYSTETGAQQALRDVTRTGVKGAKVVVERPETTLHMLRLPRASAAERDAATQALASLGEAVGGKTLQACP
jgi:hypothetical protein